MKHNLPDLIVCNPTHIYFPLFTKFIKENRKHFDKVIMVFTDMAIRDPNYVLYIREAMASEGIIFIDCPRAESGEDWRNKAIKLALNVSKAEWIYFTEQDFFPQNDFWREVGDLMVRTNVFGRYQDSRLHPCCLFIKRALLEKSSMDFSAYPDKGMDHFGLIQKWLDGKDIICGVIFSQYGYHMNGLSQNIHMLQTGEEPNYAPPEFREYVKKCLAEDMPPDMQDLFYSYLGELEDRKELGEGG